MSDALRHLDGEQLLLALYGAESGQASAHLGACPDCAARLRGLQARRAAWLAAPPPAAGPARLRAQREEVYRRIENRRRPVWRALQAGAVACALLLGVILYRPAAPPADVAGAQAISDQQLFDDLATMIARDTPAAAEPLLALFAPPEDSEIRHQ